MGHFGYLSQAPADPIFGLMAAFTQDTRPNKVNLGIGIYKDETLQVPLLSCVQIAEQEILTKRESKSYLPVEGDPIFLAKAAQFLLGDSLYQKNKDCLVLLQTVGGSSALHLGGQLLSQRTDKKIYIPNLSWPNHLGIFTECNLTVERYPYYNPSTKTLDFENTIDFLSNLPKESMILFHVSCHNPTGLDLSPLQWEQIAAVCIEKNLTPFLDAAYLGFDQTLEKDAFPIRLFLEKQIEFFLSVSFSKNLALYAERVGYFLAFSSSDTFSSVLSQSKLLVRRNYSNPPKHGASIVSHILQNSFLMNLWAEELVQMKQRICEMRNNFAAALSMQGATKDYSHILHQKGLFSLCDLSKEQIDHLIQKYAIYLTYDGRINITGLTQENLPYVTNAILEVGG